MLEWPNALSEAGTVPQSPTAQWKSSPGHHPAKPGAEPFAPLLGPSLQGRARSMPDPWFGPPAERSAIPMAGFRAGESRHLPQWHSILPAA